MNLENKRNLTDAAFVATVSLPAAGGTAYTPSFDLIQSFATSEKYAVQVDVAPTVISSGSITGFLQHSADASTWANIPECGTTVVTSAGSNIATSDQYRLPPTALEYLRAGFAVSSGATNVTAFNGSVSLRF